jgi:hypothetical protein
MNALNEVLGANQEPEPPMRDIDGAITAVRSRRILGMHLLTADNANDGMAKENQLPAPEQPLLTRLPVPQVGEMIERYIEYTDPEGTPVHLPMPFVIHYTNRPNDKALPLVTAIATLPLVLPDGTMLSGHRLNRERGIVFRVPKALEARLPTMAECSPEAVRNSMHFLTDEWLCDVATDAVGKCISIAGSLTVTERSALPDRPAYFVSAGRRGGGKTTLLKMLLMATTGISPAAAAWSGDPEERRKALVTYLLEGLPAIIWDNIPRGTQISCPHIERACTTALYTDRRLGVNELIAASAAAIHLFTGNNIGPKGDLASRSLHIRIDIDRADPENRAFRHPDPLTWTEAHRGKILHALYTILLGNPQLRADANAPANTRFKTWWRLVGSAVEHAANLCGIALDFQNLFLTQEGENDEEGASLGKALAMLASKYGTSRFTAAEIARTVNDRASAWVTDEDRERSEVLLQLLYPGIHIPPNQIISAPSIGIRLKSHLDAAVLWERDTLILRRDPHAPQDGGRATAAYVVDRR